MAALAHFFMGARSAAQGQPAGCSIGRRKRMLPPHLVSNIPEQFLLQISMDDAAARVKKLANLRDNQLEVASPCPPPPILPCPQTQPPPLQSKAAVFYVVPGAKYQYSAAVRARDSAPFYGVWFCGGFDLPGPAGDAAAHASVFAAAAKRAGKHGGAACASVEEMGKLRSTEGERVLIAPEEEREMWVA